MKTLLHKFAWWLWLKTHEVTATEIMLQEEAKNIRCVNCGKSPIDLEKTVSK